MTYKEDFYTQVLDTQSLEHIERWRHIVNSLPQPDIYFTPEYAMAFESADGETRRDLGGEAQLFFFGDDRNFIIHPFHKRRVSDLPFSELLPPESKHWSDIISPYGFSGPIACVREPELVERLTRGFWDEFHCFCFQNNIVAEFVRLHPYLRNYLPLEKLALAEVGKRSEVVYISLEPELALTRKDFSKGNKSSISKARRSGVEIVCCNDDEHLDAFCRLYTETMAKRNAQKAYFFSKEFFRKLYQLLGSSVQLFCANYNNRIIAASMFLFKGQFIHYYLSGSDVAFLHVCPNNLLLDEVMVRAKSEGYKIFDLGGGNRPSDTLFLFKSSFSKAKASFYTYSRVHNSEIYKYLCQASNKFRADKGEKSSNSDYFPEYRRPI